MRISHEAGVCTGGVPLRSVVVRRARGWLNSRERPFASPDPVVLSSPSGDWVTRMGPNRLNSSNSSTGLFNPSRRFKKAC